MAAIGAVGTVGLALQYCLPSLLIFVYRRYPDKAKMMLWVSMLVSCGSMLISSWATQVSRVGEAHGEAQELMNSSNRSGSLFCFKECFAG